MHGSRFTRHGAARLIALPVVATMVLTAGGVSMAQSPGASMGAAEPLDIAYLSFAVANSYDAPMLAAAETAAAALGANITVFDANNDFAAQTKQLQDAVSAGTYDGIITQPIYGGGLVTDVQNAIAMGIDVVNIDQILGADFTTAASQVEGLAGNVVFVPSEMGRKIGELTVQACADADPCNVGYIYSVKISGLDAALRTAFDAAIAANPAIKVVADTAESYYTAAGGLKAAQDYLVAHPDITVLVGADQAIQGALGAVDPATIDLVGYGGSAKAIQDIVDGKQFGTVVQLPATEGRMGVEQLVNAIRTGTPSEGIDTLATLPDGGVVTKANAEQFLTLAEWPGSIRIPSPTMTGDPVLLEVRGVSRTFGSTRALRDVHLGIRAGSVHALVGENGAGKSTLGKIIAGVLSPDQGQLVLRGTPVAFGSPRQALESGIAIVAQELALVPRLTVAENVFLGVEPRRAGFIDRRALGDRYQALAASSGFDLPAGVPVAALRIGQRQQVEILRALARDADLIVLDEPTAALAGPEADRLHEVIRGLAARGRTVVLVSHFLGEVLDLSDTITVLRDGQVVRTARASDETEASLIGAMLGRPGDHAFPARRPHPPDALLMLQAEDVWAPGVQGVSLAVRAGEIVGLAGLVGAGRSELGRAISGATPITSGRVLVGDGVLRGGPRGGIDAGVALIPESRKDDGLCLGRPVRENVSLASLPRLSRAGFVRRRLEGERVRAALTRVSGPRSLDAPAVTLSGGNQQKLMFARAMLGEPRVLVADEPTRGIDVGAKHQIHELLVELAGAGAAILLISSEIEEVLGLSHRVLVMRAGRIVAELSGEDMTEAAILNASFGMVPNAA